MKIGTIGRKTLVGCGLGGAALLSVFAIDEDSGAATASDTSAEQSGEYIAVNQGGQGQSQDRAIGYSEGNGQRELAALTQIRQRQCQMGNQMACQVLPQMPGYQQKLSQLEQGCRSGNRAACDEQRSLVQRITVAYAESAQVMQAGDAATAQMDNWRATMNSNAAASMAALQARGAAGQAAHAARQESYDIQNRAWAAGQDSAARTQGRFVDGIYEGTTMHGGGVQSRIDHGSVGYTDGNGNVISVPEGGRAPEGWQQMTPTYAAPR